MRGTEQDVVQVSNASGRSPFVLVCDHASNRIPERYGEMGLGPAVRLSHIAWDPGALAVCRGLADLLDAPLVYSTVSRLVIDANRAPLAEEAIWTLSEATRIAANENLDAAERAHRVTTYHLPFHDALTALLDARLSQTVETILVCIHSFTPIYLGQDRPWHIGLVHGTNQSFARRLKAAISEEDAAISVGWNEPYSANRGVTYTLEQHGDARGLSAVMIEIRNDQIREPAGVDIWTGRLARTLTEARAMNQTAATTVESRT